MKKGELGLVERCIKRFSQLFIIVMWVALMVLIILTLVGCTSYQPFEDDGDYMDWCNNIGLYNT